MILLLGGPADGKVLDVEFNSYGRELRIPVMGNPTKLWPGVFDITLNDLSISPTHTIAIYEFLGPIVKGGYLYPEAPEVQTKFKIYMYKEILDKRR